LQQANAMLAPKDTAFLMKEADTNGEQHHAFMSAHLTLLAPECGCRQQNHLKVYEMVRV
jgi:hypothetical protein